MPSIRKPRRGSLQFWPRKRAKRIYPSTSYWPASGEAKPLGFAGWKVGMTHVQLVDSEQHSPTYGKVVTRAVTVVDTAPLYVCAVRFYKDGRVVGEQWTEKPPKNLERKLGNGARKGKEISDADDVRLVVATQP